MASSQDQNNPHIMDNSQHHLSQYDFRIMQAAPDFAAHLQMPHIPLPLGTPLPPSSYDFTAQGSFHIPHGLQGPQAHPLFEGVMAMHHVLGHDLNFSWSDVTACNQQTAMVYPPSEPSPYGCDPSLDTSSLSHWSATPELIPSPMEPSHPPTPELLPEPVAESPTLEGFSPAALPPVPHTSSFAMFPLVVTRAKTHEHTIAFQADRQKSEKANSKLDPHAADFIRDKLGEHRWTIFSSRLAERRTTTQKPKKNDGASMTLNGRPPDAFSGDKAAGASAVDFLVKVEVVKSVLRTYVPHPYNPLKTLSHNFPPAPSGQVTLSRSTILSLSGWSNTQFSYWARRSEAISVLAVHDERLRTVATALERRLRTSGLSDSPSEPSSPSSSHSIQPSYEYGGISREMGVDAEDWVRMYVTGKGLDVIIDEVKKRTGVSPFLRGKHSSLDPFGTANVEGEPESGKKAVVYMPTFQAEKYVHEVPTEVDPSALSSMIAGKRAGKRKAVSPPPEGSESEDSWPSMASEVSADDFVVPHFAPLPSRTPSLSPPFLYPGESPVSPIPPSAGIDLSILESRSHYLDPIDLSQTMPPGPPPPSGRAKKRRIAPAPQPFDPQAQFADNPRLYANHLETG